MLTRLAQDNPRAISYARADAVLLLWLGAHLGADAIPPWIERLSAAGRIGSAVEKVVADALGR
jgi:hypothetical protein